MVPCVNITAKRLSCHRVCDRGTKPDQGTRCPVNTRPNPSHPRPSNELWREETYQVGFDWQAFKGDVLPCQCHSWHRVNHYTLLRTIKQGFCKDKVVLQYEYRKSQTHIHIALLFKGTLHKKQLEWKCKGFSVIVADLIHDEIQIFHMLSLSHQITSTGAKYWHSSLLSNLASSHVLLIALRLCHWWVFHRS